MTDPRTALTALITEHSALTGARAGRLADKIATEWLPTPVVDREALAEALWADQNDDPDLLWENVYNDEYHRRARNLIAEMDWQDAADVRRQTAEDIAAGLESRGRSNFDPIRAKAFLDAAHYARAAREVGGDHD